MANSTIIDYYLAQNATPSVVSGAANQNMTINYSRDQGSADHDYTAFLPLLSIPLFIFVAFVVFIGCFYRNKHSDERGQYGVSYSKVRGAVDIESKTKHPHIVKKKAVRENFCNLTSTATVSETGSQIDLLPQDTVELKQEVGELKI